MKVIRVYPDKLPYQFEIDKFKFDIFSNSYSGDIYIIGYDKDGEVLGNGAEKLIQDFPLWSIYQSDINNNRDTRYPKFNLVPRSVDGKYYPITKDNIGTKIVLSYEVV